MLALSCAKPWGDSIIKKGLDEHMTLVQNIVHKSARKIYGVKWRSSSLLCMSLVLAACWRSRLCSSMGCGAPRDLCCMTYVFHYGSFSNISSGLVASQSAWEGGLGPPEIDLFLRPNCLLNIIDHQSCHREEGKKELLHVPQKRGAFFEKLFISRMSQLEAGLVGRK